MSIATDWVVYCPAHRHYLVRASVAGTTWTEDQGGSTRYTKRVAGDKATAATWLDHHPVRRPISDV